MLLAVSSMFMNPTPFLSFPASKPGGVRNLGQVAGVEPCREAAEKPPPGQAQGKDGRKIHSSDFCTGLDTFNVVNRSDRRLFF